MAAAFSSDRGDMPTQDGGEGPPPGSTFYPQPGGIHETETHAEEDVPRDAARGFRTVADDDRRPELEPVPAWIVVMNPPGQMRPQSLCHGDNEIGREAMAMTPGANQIMVDDPKRGVGGRHALIRVKDGKYTLYDLASVNGTTLRRGDGPKEPVGAPVEIQDGDWIFLGSTAELVFKCI